MEKYIGMVLPTVLIFMGFSAIFFIVFVWQWKKRNRKNPLTIKLQRAPGESLIAQIDDLNVDISGLLALTVLLPLLFFCLHLSESYIGRMPETTSRFVINLSGMVICTTYCVDKLLKKLKLRDNYRLGYDAERAAGQELNSLLGIGYKVFHDIPCDNFNIDHVVVGRNGVFVVETKGRAKSKLGKGNHKAKVIYDGKRLDFPSWYEDGPIEQVKIASRWLSKELSASVGEVIKTHPVLCIPGWFIERKSNLSPNVYNGRNPEQLFPKIKNQELSDKFITRVAYQLERLTNDVSPKAYNPPKE